MRKGTKASFPREYILWKGIKCRCTTDGRYQRLYPTYIGCTISENFLDFNFFTEWCHSQIGWKNSNFYLDKDIIVRNNKCYSEDTCCFVPNELNSLILDSAAIRGDTPIGVWKDPKNGSFLAQCRTGKGNSRHIGIYKTVEDAFYAYKEVKEAFLQKQATKWRSEVDPRVYEALMSWEIEDPFTARQG